MDKTPKQLEFFHEYIDKDEKLELIEKKIEKKHPKILIEG